MKTLIALLLCGLALPAHATSIYGVWQYDGFHYEGHRYPNPNPDLFLTFTFDDTQSRLFWKRQNETGFCERLAEFKVSDGYLWQKVTWLNPKNSFECGKDPDMRLGSETQVRFQITDEHLELYFDINGKEFIYLLKPIACPID